MLKINNLNAYSNNKQIIKNLSLNISKGEIHAIIGPNGSGKSSLTKCIIGDNSLEIKSGEIIFNNKNINKLNIEKRSKLGIFLAYQNPIEIEGLNFRNYARLIFNNSRDKKDRLSVFDFKKYLLSISKILKISEDLLERDLNVSLSGGEKKKMEILQMALVNPKLILLDETDSGLDINSINTITLYLKEFMNNSKSMLIITHNLRILKKLPVKFVHIMKNGEIVKSKDNKLIEEILEKGF